MTVGQEVQKQEKPGLLRRLAGAFSTGGKPVLAEARRGARQLSATENVLNFVGIVESALSSSLRNQKNKAGMMKFGTAHLEPEQREHAAHENKRRILASQSEQVRKLAKQIRDGIEKGEDISKPLGELREVFDAYLDR